VAFHEQLIGTASTFGTRVGYAAAVAEVKDGRELPNMAFAPTLFNRRLSGNERIEKQQNARREKQAADHHERHKGKRSIPTQAKCLDDEP
jgi:hypothetical protein